MTAACPAILQAAVETETEEGGRVRAWTDVTTVWLALAYGGASEDAAQEMRPVRVETATAVAREHPDAAVGQQLVVEGEASPWRVLAVRRGEPAAGRMTLVLDRTS